MARRRHETHSSKSAREHQREQKAIADLRLLSKRGVRVDPTNNRAIATKARELRQRDALVKNYGKTVDKKTAAKLKERGFMVEGRKVVIDVPRDRNRKKIRGAKMDVLKDGTVKYAVKQRRDYIVGMTKTERKAFAKNPELVTQQILKRLRDANPTLKKMRPSRIQTRLQWGAFQATKDYSPSYFTKHYFATISPEDRREGRKNPRLDKLTGLHFVVHIPQKRKAKHGGKKRKR
jgi:hypothetical protein